MYQTVALVLAWALFGAGGPDPLSVSATIPGDSLDPKTNLDLVIKVDIDDAWQGGKGLIAKPIVQFDVPECVRLRGESPKDLRALAKNEFIRTPDEVLVEGGSATIPFRLKEPPADGDAIRFNVLAYVTAAESTSADGTSADGTSADGADTRFIRKRFEIPLTPGASAKEIAVIPSTWGDPKLGLLQLNDAAPGFEIPTAAGGIVSPGKYKGKKNVVVMTYRAFW